MPSHSLFSSNPLTGKCLACIRLAILAAIASLFFGAASSTAHAEEPTKAPAELLRYADVNLESVRRGKIIHRSWVVFPQNFDDTIVPAGVLTKLKKHPEVTGLRLQSEKMSDASSDTFYLDVTPGALADIGKLTHLEHISILGVDLTRGDGLKFLKPLNRLRTINFSYCKVEVQDVLAHLPPCKDLETLRVNYAPKQKSREPATRRRVVTAQQIKRLVKNSPKLRLIVWHSTEQFEPEAIAQFAQLKALDYLHVTYIYMAKSPHHNARQQAEGQRLKKLFEAKGMREVESARRLKRHYSLPYHIIHLPKSSKLKAPLPKCRNKR